jgi:lantibiotic biosynthesis protein
MTPPTDLDHRQMRAAQEVAAELTATLVVSPEDPPSDDHDQPGARWKDQSLSQGAAGIAILHGVRTGHDSLVHTWLARATRDSLSGGPSAGLWFGAPAVAFAISMAAPDRYHRALTRLDNAIAALVTARLAAADARMTAAARPSLSEFDLVHGLTGLGAYLLHRQPHSRLLLRILTYLVRHTEPIRARDLAGATVPGWWTSDPPPGSLASAYPGGYADLGIAHGITGPLALLALAERQGVTVDQQTEAIDRICRWLDVWRQDTPAGPWWPERISWDEVRAGRPIPQVGPPPPSWC